MRKRGRTAKDDRHSACRVLSASRVRSRFAFYKCLAVMAANDDAPRAPHRSDVPRAEDFPCIIGTNRRIREMLRRELAVVMILFAEQDGATEATSAKEMVEWPLLPKRLATYLLPRITHAVYQNVLATLEFGLPGVVENRSHIDRMERGEQLPRLMTLIVRIFIWGIAQGPPFRSHLPAPGSTFPTARADSFF
jgi:hypothetical protein